jgi:hypothetical protein
MEERRRGRKVKRKEYYQRTGSKLVKEEENVG